VSRRNTAVRSLHDLGLAAWFGGSLMGAVGVNGASRDMALRDERVQVATDAWGRFSPFAAVGIGAHLLGGLGLLVANRGRVRHQQGVAASTAAKTALTGAALGATGYAWWQGTRLGDAEQATAAAATVPSGETHPRVAGAQQQLRVLQWAIPAATGGLVVLNALHGEQQRPDQQLAGRVAGRVRSTARDARTSYRSAQESASKAAHRTARKTRQAVAH